MSAAGEYLIYLPVHFGGIQINFFVKMISFCDEQPA
jgi:hypothetical protein